MIDHLADYKVGYWDAEIRDLTSKVCHRVVDVLSRYGVVFLFEAVFRFQAMHNFVELDPIYVCSKMKTMVKNLYSINLNLRHGSILCLAEIIHACSRIKEPRITHGRISARNEEFPLMVGT